MYNFEKRTWYQLLLINLTVGDTIYPIQLTQRKSYSSLLNDLLAVPQNSTIEEWTKKIKAPLKKLWTPWKCTALNWKLDHFQQTTLSNWDAKNPTYIFLSLFLLFHHHTTRKSSLLHCSHENLNCPWQWIRIPHTLFPVCEIQHSQLKITMLAVWLAKLLKSHIIFFTVILPQSIYCRLLDLAYDLKLKASYLILSEATIWKNEVCTKTMRLCIVLLY